MEKTKFKKEYILGEGYPYYVYEYQAIGLYNHNSNEVRLNTTFSSKQKCQLILRPIISKNGDNKKIHAHGRRKTDK